ncbi:hypothetical protein HY948_03905 [Candidatus Gottesmanbacteria bacterium]|nr:hypothetical protein [Candidatus Gottesmanbacteria bacterium]
MKRSFFFSVLFIIIVYRPWFAFNRALSGGDWPYVYRQSAESFPLLAGKGYLWLDTYFNIAAKFGMQYFGLSWELTEKIFWFFPFLLIVLVSSWYFLNEVFLSERRDIRAVLCGIGSIVYSTNSYILMIAGGGQMGVAMGYALAPAVIGALRRRSSVVSVGLSALQLMFDPRLFIITIIGYTGIEVIYSSVGHGQLKRSATLLLIVVFFTVLLNAFWIVPNFFDYRGMYEGATQGDTLSYFSFATFSNSLALLHPNWPENIFGKVGFMRPEYIFVAVVAYSGIALLRKGRHGALIAAFAAIALAGAFLSKGVQDPAGSIYRFLAKIPGFMVFRDPTKFYLLTALSYSVLIPYSVSNVFRKIWPVTAILFLFFWSVLSFPALRGDLGGTFAPKLVPASYTRLYDWLVARRNASHILWIPKHQRFGYATLTQKAISSQDEIADVSPNEFADILNSAEGKKMITERGIGLFIIPADSEKEIFLTDRSYDDAKRKAWISAIDTVNWVEKITIPGVADSITVYNVVY